MVENFDAKLKEYARLLVEIGVNVQPGQTVRLRPEVSCAPLARLCVEACYDRGAREVVLEWDDDFVLRQKFLRAAEDVFGDFPAYEKARYDWYLDRGAVDLSILGSDPELLKGVDPARMQAYRRAAGNATKAYGDALDANKFQWSVAAHPVPSWAKKVFPDLPEAQAMDALWDAIFSVCRIDGDGKAVQRWREHIDTTARRCGMLNGYNFKSLHYTNSLGTDLTVQLPENHVWIGGSEKTPAGVEFVPNMPTEEIFTAPRWDGVDGRVYGALPMSMDGNLVKDFYLDFQGGRIVDVHAEQGEDVLRHAIDVDEGSRYLGEAALVPFDSPIRNKGILFYETLFDENASCHFAFGSAYPTCVKGGAEMSEDEQKAAGLNQSINHVDFMVGTADLSIVGTTHDGKEVPVFVDGNFAF